MSEKETKSGFFSIFGGFMKEIVILINTILEYIFSKRREEKVLRSKLKEAEDALQKVESEIKVKVSNYEDVNTLFIQRKQLVQVINEIKNQLEIKEEKQNETK